MTSRDLDKLLQDISAMKTVIDRNKPLIRKIFEPSHFRTVSWIWGVGMVLFSLGIQVLISAYGSFGQLPQGLKTGIYAAVILFCVALSVLKQRLLLRSLRREMPDITLTRVMRAFFSFHIRHVYVPMVGVLIFLMTILNLREQYIYIVPALSVFVGMIFNYFGSLTGIRQFLTAGYWFLITGCLLLTFDAIPPMVGMALSLGCGSILFAAVSKGDRRRDH